MELNPKSEEAVELLKQLIATPSYSKEEGDTFAYLKLFMENKGFDVQSIGWNLWATNKYFDDQKPTILLNSHHDTVKPNSGYTLDPFHPEVKDGKLFGLGSNDAGGALVSLLQVFCHFYGEENLNYNLVFAATAEEEISGKGGISSILPSLPNIDFAIVGEPTEMNLAIAEKGLMVIDAEAQGIPGHVANSNSLSAVHVAATDVVALSSFNFEKVSPWLGEVKVTVSKIEGGSQHNVAPATCSFVIDVRNTDAYTNEEVLAVLQGLCKSDLKARSLRLKPSGISEDHAVVQAGLSLGKSCYGSPTLSDQALLSCPSLKMGPGKSERSHTANEYIYLKEIEEGIETYLALLEKIVK